MGGAATRTTVAFFVISLLTVVLLSASPPARGQGAILEVPTMFPTIQAAVDAAVYGDTVLVLPGTYYANVYLENKGGITLKGTDPWTTILDGRGAGDVLYIYGGGQMTIEGFTIRGSGRTGNIPGSVGILVNSGFFVHIRRNIITDNGVGVEMMNALDGDCYVEGNLIFRNNQSGIMNDGCGRPQILGNTIVENGFAGYRSWVGAGPVTIRNNIVASNHVLGIGVHQSDVPRVIDHNDVYGNAGKDYCEGYYTICDNAITPGPGSLSTDALFVSVAAGDYRLRAGSPCVDTGANEVSLPLDLAGFPRPIDGNKDGIPTVDLGAHEALGYVTHAPIQITGNAGFGPANGVVGGRGTSRDPYIISGWEIEGNGTPALEIRGTNTFFVVRDLSIPVGDREGALLVNVSNGQVDNVTVTHVRDGIRLEGAVDDMVSAGHFHGNTRGIVAVNSTRLVVQDTDVSRNAESGLIVETSSQISVIGNRADGNPAVGIALDQVSDSDVIRNNLTGNPDGIRLSASRNVTLDSNQLARNGHGIRLIASMGITLRSNHLVGDGILLEGSAASDFDSDVIGQDNTANGLPIRYERDCSGLRIGSEALGSLILANCTDVVVSGLAISEGDIAVLVAYVDGLNFTGNVLQENLEGLRLFASSNASISDNRFIRNQIPFVPLDSRGILFAHDDVIHNTVQAYVATGNDVRWDAGYPDGGNYWSDRTTPDRCSGPDQTTCSGSDGIADSPYAFGQGAQDRYPLMRPFVGPAVPPSPDIVWTPTSPAVEETASFNGSRSVDEDGLILSYLWDFGDGSSASGTSVLHGYVWPGNYSVSLAVTDNSGLTATRSVTVGIPRPFIAPRAAFAFSPGEPTVGDAIAFSAEPSSDRYGEIVRYEWQFGDSAGEFGRSVNHTFASEGAYQISLTVTNDRGLTDSATQSVIVNPKFARFEHSSGFAILVPTNWELQQDRAFEGRTIELVLLGPVYKNFRTNILVETDSDSSVRETRAYLESAAKNILASIRSDHPDASLLEDLQYRQLGGHAAVSFAVAYPQEGLVQKAALVVSDAHDRFWLLILSMDGTEFSFENTIFERMLSSFAITAAPLILGLPAPLFFGLTAFVVAVAVAALLLVRRWSKRRHSPSRIVRQLALPPGEVLSGLGVAQFCMNCGSRTDPPYHFCAKCGAPISPGFVNRPRGPSQ